MKTSETVDLGGSVEKYLSGYFETFGDALPPPGLYHRILREVEYPLISAALAATRGNQIKAAELLGRQPQHFAQENPGFGHTGYALHTVTLEQNSAPLFT
jgi:DNA-binding protein Fis